MKERGSNCYLVLESGGKIEKGKFGLARARVVGDKISMSSEKG